MYAIRSYYAELAVMSGNSAAKVLLQIETASLKKQGETITKEKDVITSYSIHYTKLYEFIFREIPRTYQKCVL